MRWYGIVWPSSKVKLDCKHSANAHKKRLTTGTLKNDPTRKMTVGCSTKHTTITTHLLNTIVSHDPKRNDWSSTKPGVAVNLPGPQSHTDQVDSRLCHGIRQLIKGFRGFLSVTAFSSDGAWQSDNVWHILYFSAAVTTAISGQSPNSVKFPDLWWLWRWR